MSGGRVRGGVPPGRVGNLLTRSLAGALLATGTAVAAAVESGETYGGLPQGQEVEVLRNPGFLVGYSEARRQPLWVAYRAETLKGAPPLGPRPRFEVDPRTRAKVSHADYKGSGYTRGHLAPNFVIGKLYGPQAQRATFLMSNIAPQRRRLNELAWQRLEEAEADIVAPAAIQLWVIAGPLFGPQPPRLRSGIPVPEAFYRIWLDVEQGVARALAFIVPQDVCGTEPLSRYLASVDAIEQRSGVDFFAALADEIESELEREAAPAPWRLERFEHRAARYAGNFDGSPCGAG